MLQQLNRVDDIIEMRQQNGLYMIDRLESLPWLRLPPKDNNVFSKFTMFIDHPEEYIPPGKGARSQVMRRFIQHMAEHGVQVEETTIPLHHRNPDIFNEEKYKTFHANMLWKQAVCLPCRPQLTGQELDTICEAVKVFDPTGKIIFMKDKWASKHRKGVKAQKGFFENIQEIRTKWFREHAKGKTAADFGCGSGDMMMPLLAHGYNVVGIDFSKPALEELHEIAAKQDLKVTVYENDLTDMKDIPDESFDCGACVSTLYHVENVKAALSEIARTMKTGGKVLIELGNSKSLNEPMSKRGEVSMPSFHITTTQMQEYLNEAGFSILNWRTFQIFPLYGSRFNFALRDLFEKYHIFDQEVNGELTLMLDELV